MQRYENGQLQVPPVPLKVPLKHANQQMLKQALHLLGKTNSKVDKMRAELGVSAPTVNGTAANSNNNMNNTNGMHDGNDSGVEESKGDDNDGYDSDIDDVDVDTVTEVFIPETPFNSVVDYYIPASTEPFIAVLLGKTIRTEIRGIDAEHMVAETAKCLAMCTAPTSSVYALLGYIKSVVLRVPSDSLYDSKSGLSLVIHDTPGMVVNDALRAECSTNALKAELNSNANTGIPHVVTNGDTPSDVYEGLSSAGVFNKLLTDPELLCVIKVFPSHKWSDDHERMDDDSIDIVKENELNTFRSHLTNRAASMQQAGSAQCQQLQQAVDRAMNSVQFATVDTHPSKITAQLKGNTAAAQPDLSEFEDALTAHTTAVW
jgi:hypothetical protein